jgi:import receptor subunit TOM70
MQNKPEEAKKDLEKCVKLSPNHVMARLRLASILATTDVAAARRQLDVAEASEPSSSEVHSYRGELHFTVGEMEEATRQFEKAIELEPTNPTPYVNCAMSKLNTPPPPGQLPDPVPVMNLLEKAIEVDPQFAAAYIQLGQLKLGTATDLTVARQVIELYDQGIENCRSPEELKELCGMRALGVAQVAAATMLKMETFNMQ